MVAVGGNESGHQLWLGDGSPIVAVVIEEAVAVDADEEQRLGEQESHSSMERSGFREMGSENGISFSRLPIWAAVLKLLLNLPVGMGRQNLSHSTGN